MPKKGDKKRDKKLQGEFAAEAQEVIEAFSRALLEMDAVLKVDKTPHPDTVNEAFRATHTLKGLSSLFGQQQVAGLAHELEEVLDAIRMGRLGLGADVLDLLFDAVDYLSRTVRAGDGADTSWVDAFRTQLADLLATPEPSSLDLGEALQHLNLNAELLQTLTEYEEHRLQENLVLGRSLYLVHGDFDVKTIDAELEELRTKLKTLGEVITCLPSDEEVGEDRIGLDLMLATSAEASDVERVAASLGSRAEVMGTEEPAPTPIEEKQPTADTRAPMDAPRESLRSLSRTVRVNIDKLDRLMNSVGELTLVRNELRDILRSVQHGEVDLDLQRRFMRQMRTFQRRLDEMQRGILEVRMVPLAQVFDKLARVVRKLSREFNKQISFYVSGGETEIDKLIVEELSDPLMHIIRNCIDHGIEDPIARTAAGKPAEGMVALRAFPRGNHVVIEVEDDGAGIDPDAILAQALDRGFVTPDAAEEMTRREVLNLIFMPGFTTRREVGRISGRGVGMDVVKTNLANLSGLIDVFSEPGKGTRFTLTLPITLAIIRALIVQLSDQMYAIPLATVLEIFPIRRAHVGTIEGREVVTLRGATLPLLRLEPVFGLASVARPALLEVGHEYIVVVGMAQHRVGVVVNELVGQQDIVVKSLGKSLSEVPGIAGATELGGRRTVLVLDIASLVDEFTSG